MKKLRYILVMLTALVLSLSVAAQNNPVTMADTMRSNGRIYVVVAVVLTILTGLILYVFRLDRKISKMEKEAS